MKSVFTTPLIEVPVECTCGRHHVGRSHFGEKQAQARAEAKCKACENDMVHYGAYIDRGVRANMSRFYIGREQ